MSLYSNSVFERDHMPELFPLSIHFTAPISGAQPDQYSPDKSELEVALALPALTLESHTLTDQERLSMYLAAARRAEHWEHMETTLTMALRLQRTMAAAAISSTMPTAMKIKTCEIPVLQLFLQFGQRSPEWRALIVKMLADNVQSGCGHLTVNRAKQVLKELAKRAGLTLLTAELRAPTATRRAAAIVLSGWLKNERAIEPLIDCFEELSEAEKILLLATLETHYLPKLAYHLKWRRQNKKVPAAALLALLNIA